jgi:hypothetical protein
VGQAGQASIANMTVCIIMNAKWIARMMPGMSRWHIQVHTDSSTGKEKNNCKSTLPHNHALNRKASPPPSSTSQASTMGDPAPLLLPSEPELDPAADDSELADARLPSFSTMVAHRAPPSGGSGCFSSPHESGSGSSTSHSTVRWTVTCKSCRS